MILNYFGSKARSIEKIEKVLAPHINRNTVFGDLFAGTGVVGNHFKNRVKQVVSNDLELYAYVMNKALLTTVYTSKLQAIIKTLNHLEPKEGLIYENFSPHGGKMFFTSDNAKQIDAVRSTISSYYKTRAINYKEFVFLLASLLYSVTRCANTAGTFRAYLKQFHGRALKPFCLAPVHTDRVLSSRNQVTNRDALDISKQKFDLVYLDPPYNAHHYGAYYSFFNYLCIYSRNTKISSNTGVMQCYNKSQFGLRAYVKNAMKELIDNLDATKIAFHYNSNGILGKAELVRLLMNNGGSLTVYKYLNRNYKPNANIKNSAVVDYIFFINRNDKTGFKEVWL